MKGGKFLDALSSPTNLPGTVEIGAWLEELVGTLQSQLDMVASGAAMLPYEYLTKRYLNESIPLGATANFQHETNGTLVGRFVKLGAPNTTGHARPVGLRASSSQLYEVTDKIDESSPSLFAGLDLSGPNETGEYGWILINGVCPVSPALTGNPTHLGEVGWATDDSLAADAATAVGRLVSNGPNLQVLLNIQPVPVNDATLAGAIDRINGKLVTVQSELATKPDSTQIQRRLRGMIITSITAVNQTVDLIQNQLKNIDTNYAGVQVEQTLKAMADFRVELAAAGAAQDAVRQQVHVNAQASQQSRDLAQVWSDQSNIYAQVAAERAAFAAVKGVESEASAELSEGYAANASLSEANALTYSNLAATYKTAAGLAVSNAFPEVLDGAWLTTTGTGSPESKADFPNGSGTLLAGVYTSPVGVNGANALYKAVVPWSSGRIYEVSVDVEALAATGGTIFVLPYARRMDSSYNDLGEYYTTVALTVGARTTITYRFGMGVTPAGGINVPSCAFVRFGFLINYGTAADRQTKLYRLSLRDVTALVASESQASIAQSAAVSASDSAASASTSMTLAANLGFGAINGNAGFDDYPSATAGQLPTGWLSWISTATAQRVADTLGGYSIQLPGLAAANGGIYFGNLATNQINTNDYYVIEADITLTSGTLAGAGSLFSPYNNASVAIQNDLYINFATDPDATGAAVGAGVVGNRYKYSKLVKVTAAGAYGYRLYAISHWSTLGSIAVANVITFHKCLVRPATLQEIRDKTVLSPMEATVSTHTSAIATLNGSAATWETVVAAGGGFPAIARLKAGVGGSEIALAASKLLVLNPSNTGAYQEVARFEGGRAVLNDAIIRKLTVGPRSNSEIYFPVQLRPRAYLGKHNDVIQYEGGKTLGAVPLRITPDTTGIAVASGDALDVRAVSITTTQFTVKAVKITPSSPANQATGAGTNVGGTPAWQVHKPTTADAFNGYYNFKATITLTLVNSIYNEFQDKYRNYYLGSVRLYCNAGSSWVLMETVALNPSTLTTSPASPGSTLSYSIDYTTQYNTAIGQHAGREFGIHATSGTITAFAGVSYTTQYSGTEVALTQMIPFLVYPPESD